MAGAASARSVAMFVGVPLIIGALLAMVAARRRGAEVPRTAEI